jgi:hypothetical protein
MKTISDIITETEKPTIQTVREFKTSHENIPGTGCKPDCPICGGFGMVRRDLPIHDPNFGRAFPCPNADLFTLYGKRTGILESERALDWSKIIKNENVMQGVQAVGEALDRGYGWVFLWGGVGLAKTLILKIAVAESLRGRKQASYARMAEVIDDLRGSFDADRPSREGDTRLRWWTESPVLCLDEFDRLRQTEYAEERRFVIMDNRYESALDRKTVTIMASNTNPATYDPYLFDRLRDGRFKIVKLTGESARPMMGLDQ